MAERISKGFEAIIPLPVLLENMLREIKSSERLIEECSPDVELEIEEAEKLAGDDRSALDIALSKRTALEDLKNRIQEVRDVHASITQAIAKEEDVSEEKRGALASYQALKKAYQEASSLVIPGLG